LADKLLCALLRQVNILWKSEKKLSKYLEIILHRKFNSNQFNKTMSEALIVVALIFVGYSANKIAKRRRRERRARREEEERMENYPRTYLPSEEEDLPEYELPPNYAADEVKEVIPEEKKKSFGQRLKSKLRPNRTGQPSAS
jgi:hypothetical protein